MMACGLLPLRLGFVDFCEASPLLQTILLELGLHVQTPPLHYRFLVWQLHMQAETCTCKYLAVHVQA